MQRQAREPRAAAPFLDLALQFWFWLLIQATACPVIGNGDNVLLEEINFLGNAAPEAMTHDMVAFEASRNGESFAYLKRVGTAISDSLRMFETVGSIGDAVPAQGLDPMTEIKGETP